MRLFQSKWVKGILAVVALPIVALFLNELRASTRLERQIERIRAAGHPTTADELNAMYPPIPDEENAALIYLEAMRQHEEMAYDDTGVPVVGDDGADFPADDMAFPAETLERMGVYVTAHRLILDQLHSAALMERALFVKYLTDTYDNIDHLSRMRQCARMLAVEAYYEIESGNSQRAIEAFEAGCAVANAFSSCPLLIHQLTRVGIVGIVLGPYSRMLTRLEFTNDDLQRLDHIVQRLMISDAHLTRTFVADRAHTLASLRSGLGEITPELDSLDSILIDPGAWVSLGATALLEMFAYRTGIYEDLWTSELVLSESYLATIPRPYLESKPLRDQLIVDAENLMPAGPSLQLAGLFVGSNFEWYLRMEHRIRAKVACARAVIAIERFSLANGKLPGALDELVPEYIPEIPLDPFDDTPIKFLSDADGYTLYSVGINEQDEKGRIDSRSRYGDTGFRILNKAGRSSPSVPL